MEISYGRTDGRIGVGARDACASKNSTDAISAAFYISAFQMYSSSGRAGTVKPCVPSVQGSPGDFFGTQSPDFVSQFSFEEISKIGEKKSGFQLFSQDNQKFSIISIKTPTSSDDNLPIISMFC